MTQIKLTSRELHAIATLKYRLSKSNNTLTSNSWIPAIEELFRESRHLMSKIGDASHNNSLYVGQVTFFGIIIRAHELFLGGIEQIYLDNRHLLQASARGLIETIGLVCFVSEKPSKVHSLLLDYDIPAGKLMHKASKRIKNAGDFYNKLSSWVHPGKNSLLAGFKPIGNGDNKTYISLPPPSLSENEIYRVLETLIGLVKIFYDSTNAFLEKYSNYLIDGILAGEKANLFVP